MNKKIEEIIEQCSTDVGSYDPYGENRIIKFDKEKFAELIIKETLEVVRDEVQYALDDYLADTIDIRVKNHFGVE